jgi:triosephosphate isomerase
MHKLPRNALYSHATAYTVRVIPRTNADCIANHVFLLSTDRNGNAESTTSIIKNLNSANLDKSVEVVVSPPALYLLQAREVANKEIGVAAQNVFDKPNGAFTGEISVQQLREANIDWTILGHSERRVILKETDEVCPLKHFVVIRA